MASLISSNLNRPIIDRINESTNYETISTPGYYTTSTPVNYTTGVQRNYTAAVPEAIDHTHSNSDNTESRWIESALRATEYQPYILPTNLGNSIARFEYDPLITVNKVYQVMSDIEQILKSKGDIDRFLVNHKGDKTVITIVMTEGDPVQITIDKAPEYDGPPEERIEDVM